MPSEPRLLPHRPNLRYLKLEAKRRLTAGEFAALHDAQTAIALEHGLPSWAALKLLICDQSEPGSHALAQLRWIIARFRDAGRPGWAPPGENEMRQHFADEFLAVIPASELTPQITRQAAGLRQEPVVITQELLRARIQIAQMEFLAAAEASPPHRLIGLAAQPAILPVTDPRMAAPPATRLSGDAPTEVAVIAEKAFAELGLAALIITGGRPGAPSWAVTKGWADLDRAEELAPAHRFPWYAGSALVTVTAVLRLAADGRIRLDDPANDHLHTVRLADGAITVRELLSHTSGVNNPAELFADSVPSLAAVLGPVARCDGPRGVVRPSNGGYAMLGQLVADVTGSTYADAAARMVLAPLGMTGSAIPARAADLGPRAVTGYDVTPEGTLRPVPAQVTTIPAIGGLWATTADMAALATGWASLLPAALAREALSPQTAPLPDGHQLGLGWIIQPGGVVALQAGAAPGGSTSLHLQLSDYRVHATATSRLLPINTVSDRVLHAWASPAP